MNPATMGGARIVAKADKLATRERAQKSAAGDLWREAVEAGATFGELLSRPGLPLRSAVRLARATLAAVDDWRERAGLEPGILAELEAVPEPETPDFLRGREDWRRELAAAWDALPAEDQAAFLARVHDGVAP